MRKTIAFLICVVTLMASICGCSNSRNKDSQSGYNAEDVYISLYKKPADAVSIDLTKEDPSNDDIRFVFDDLGRVTQCYYKLDDVQVYVSYSYEDGSAHIYAFMNDIVAAEEQIQVSSFDSEKGFSVIDGYYFKGYADNK